MAMPVYEIATHQIISKKIGRFTAPVAATLDFDNVFDGRSLCLLQELSTLNDGQCAHVESIAILVKLGARSTTDGWVCDYRKNM